jgi:hypothetical protein
MWGFDMIMIAEWVSAGRKHWVRLHKHVDANGCATSYGYRSDNGGGGSLGPAGPANPAITDESAIQVMQVRVDTGYFLPDIAVHPMRRVV